MHYLTASECVQCDVVVFCACVFVFVAGRGWREEKQS